MEQQKVCILFKFTYCRRRRPTCDIMLFCVNKSIAVNLILLLFYYRRTTTERRGSCKIIILLLFLGTGVPKLPIQSAASSRNSLIISYCFCDYAGLGDVFFAIVIKLYYIIP